MQVTVQVAAAPAEATAQRTACARVPMGASFEHEIEPILVPLLNDAKASAAPLAGPPADSLDRVDTASSVGSTKSGPDAPPVPRANAVGGGGGGGGSTPHVQNGSAVQAGRSHSQSLVDHIAGGRPVTLMPTSALDVASAFGQRLDVVRQCTEFLFDNKTSEARKVCALLRQLGIRTITRHL